MEYKTGKRKFPEEEVLRGELEGQNVAREGARFGAARPNMSSKSLSAATTSEVGHWDVDQRIRLLLSLYQNKVRVLSSEQPAYVATGMQAGGNVAVKVQASVDTLWFVHGTIPIAAQASTPYLMLE